MISIANLNEYIVVMPRRCVEEYDLERDAWAPSSARLATPRKYAAAVSWQGRIIVVGGVTEPRARLAGCEALDPREGRWVHLPDMLVSHWLWVAC